MNTIKNFAASNAFLLESIKFSFWGRKEKKTAGKRKASTASSVSNTLSTQKNLYNSSSTEQPTVWNILNSRPVYGSKFIQTAHSRYSDKRKSSAGFSSANTNIVRSSLRTTQKGARINTLGFFSEKNKQKSLPAKRRSRAGKKENNSYIYSYVQNSASGHSSLIKKAAAFSRNNTATRLAFASKNRNVYKNGKGNTLNKKPSAAPFISSSLRKENKEAFATVNSSFSNITANTSANNISFRTFARQAALSNSVFSFSSHSDRIREKNLPLKRKSSAAPFISSSVRKENKEEFTTVNSSFSSTSAWISDKKETGTAPFRPAGKLPNSAGLLDNKYFPTDAKSNEQLQIKPEWNYLRSSSLLRDRQLLRDFKEETLTNCLTETSKTVHRENYNEKKRPLTIHKLVEQLNIHINQPWEAGKHEIKKQVESVLLQALEGA
ncbi:MAG: hypothetical protein MI784_12130 [Cytophagales bacterium]|nr:hypothetical protein [Cytophagales bacterium]